MKADDVTVAPVGCCFGVYIRDQLACVRADQAEADRAAVQLREVIVEPQLASTAVRPHREQRP